MFEEGEGVFGTGLLKAYQAPGTPPGTLRGADGETGPSTIVVTSYTTDEVEIRELADPAALDALRTDPRTHWIHVIGLADIALVERLGTVFGLHPLALEDVLTLGQRPKMEEFDDTLFCVVQHLAYQNDALEKTQVALFLGTGFILTFQPQGPDLLVPVRDRISKGRGRLRQKGAGYLAYAILDLIAMLVPVSPSGTGNTLILLRCSWLARRR